MERVVGPRAVVAVLLCLLLGVLAACGGTPYVTDQTAVLQSQEQVLLDTYAQALRTHNRATFLQTIDDSDRALVRRQLRYFDNIAQLPLSKLSFRILQGGWPGILASPKWGAVHLVRVAQSIDLTDYDTAPERSLTGFAIGLRDGVLKIVSDRTRTGAFFPGYQPSPWDLDRIHVRQSAGVMGVFDDAMVSKADELLQDVDDGVADDQQALPFAWDGRVVFYSFADQRVLNSFQHVPGGNIRDLGGLSFPVYGDLHDKSVVGERFILLPSSVAAGEPFLGMIVRHELTHVALGQRDQGAPTWLIEGLAEYLASRPLPRSEWRITSVAPVLAAQPVTAMPDSATFNGPDQSWHYALSWMACDYIAATQGEATLWALMDAFHNGGAGTPAADQDTVLRNVIGMDGAQLAEHAAARIRRLFS